MCPSALQSSDHEITTLSLLVATAADTQGKASANSSSLEAVDPSLAPTASAVGDTPYGATDPLLADSSLTSAGDEFMVRLAHINFNK